MKRIVPALLCLLLVFGAALLRPRLGPTTHPLPASPQRVILIAVEGMGTAEAQEAFHRTKFSAYGLMPTRNGTPDEADFGAGFRMILSGSRTPKPDADTLPEIAKKQRAALDVYALTGTDAVRDAVARFTELTTPGRVSGQEAIFVFGVTPSKEDLRQRRRIAPVLFWSTGSGTGFPQLMTSPSTRNRPGLIAATDIATTVATLLDLPAGVRRVGDGRAIEAIPFPPDTRFSNGAATLPETLQSAVATWGLQAREQKCLPVLPWILAVLFLLAECAPQPAVRRSMRAAMLSAPLGIVGLVSLVPAPTPGYSPPAWLIYLIATAWVMSIAALAVLRPRWGERSARFLATATALFIASDMCTGAFHLSRTPLSYSVLEAARFYGIGNEISGLFLGSAILAIGCEQSTAATLIWGMAVATVLGAPSLGADAGGLIAALVAFATLVIVGKRKSETTRRRFPVGSLISGFAIVGAVTAFAFWDASRPETTRTHVGQAVASAREKGADAIATLAERKVRVNLRLLTTSPWAILLYTQVALLLWRQQKRKRQGQVLLVPAVDPVSTTLFVTMLTLFVLNDSGVVAGAMCGCWCSGVGEASGRDADDVSPMTADEAAL